MEERRTLQELASQSNGDLGLRCPKCHCGHLPGQKTFETLYSRPLGQRNSKRRKIKCRNCGYEFETAERVVGIPE